MATLTFATLNRNRNHIRIKYITVLIISKKNKKIPIKLDKTIDFSSFF